MALRTANRTMTAIKISFLVVCAILAYIYMGQITWVPFILLAVFIFVREFFLIKRRVNDSSSASKVHVEAPPVGVLGHYKVDNEIAYGLFMLLEDKNIFIDIREDPLIIQREEVARSLFENSNILEQNLAEFRSRNNLFKTDSIESFGVHSIDLNIVEVFWSSERYTTMKDFKFIDDV